MLTTIATMIALAGIGGPAAAYGPPVVQVEAVGVGYPPARMQGAQGRLMARRAAEVSAVWNLYREIDPTGRSQHIPFRYVSSQQRRDGSVVVTVVAYRQVR